MSIKPHVLSVNVSQIKEVFWKGKIVTTGIFKEPTIGKLKVEGVNIEGDDQADRRVHGGVNKAVYCYPYDHYDFWKEKYPHKEFTSGMFGENLTTFGLLENELYIGDKLKVGTAELIVVQPRMPCYKLGIKFGTQQILKQFTEAEKPGFYCKIAQEGELETGDEIILERNNDPKVTVVDVIRIMRRNTTKEVLQLAAEEEHLPEGLRMEIRKHIEQ